MEKYNCIIVINQTFDRVLMCLRSKDPYKGLYNLVGGRVEDQEQDLEAAYRELYEETGIPKTSIQLLPLMDFRYHQAQVEVQAYVGLVDDTIDLVEEVHSLHWLPLTEDFFDMSKFAGEGNIGHMIEHVYFVKDDLLALRDR